MNHQETERRQRNVLVGADFSPALERNTEAGVSLAKAYDAHLWLLHVASLEDEPADLDAGPDTVRDRTAANIKDHRSKLRALAEAVAERENLPVTPLLVDGEVSQEVLKHASQVKADLIVIGAASKRTVLGRLTGSVCDEIVRGASVPVVLVPLDAAKGGAHV